MDKIAAECMAHSKSGSGVSEITRRSDWSDCFDRIDAMVMAYNADHPDTPIFFNRSAIENNDAVFTSMIFESFALSPVM